MPGMRLNQIAKAPERFLPQLGSVLLFFLLVFAFKIHSQGKVVWISGDLEDAGVASGKSYFSVKSNQSGKIHHILCTDSLVDELRKTLKSSSDRKIHIHAKAELVHLGSPLWRCVNQPRWRTTENRRSPARGESDARPSDGRMERESSSQATKSSYFNQGRGERYIAGQVLEADPESGLLTIQTAQRKSYLKIDPSIANQIHQKLSRMEIYNIEGKFIFDRNRGYFVKTNDLR